MRILGSQDYSNYTTGEWSVILPPEKNRLSLKKLNHKLKHHSAKILHRSLITTKSGRSRHPKGLVDLNNLCGKEMDWVFVDILDWNSGSFRLSPRNSIFFSHTDDSNNVGIRTVRNTLQ